MIMLPLMIEEVEKRWLHNLMDACTDLFSKTNMPSHNQWHHMRVWQNAKRIMLALYASGYNIPQNDIEQIIIAIFFHDTGLTTTLDEHHGKASSDICEAYFKNSLIEKPSNFENILKLIELHEDKEYEFDMLNESSPEAIIAASDDIDAFGTIGIYRYAEIYLLRGVGLMQLPLKVISNLDSRYSNMLKKYGRFEEFFNEVRLKYWITREFYSDLQKQYESPVLKEKTGPYGVIQIFKEDVMKNKMTLKDIALQTAVSSTSLYVREFFTLLISDIDKTENEY
jgi:HD superfamily phosphodiesterase